MIGEERNMGQPMKLSKCKHCGSEAAPTFVSDEELGEVEGRRSPYDYKHWCVICDYTKGGCGARSGYDQSGHKAIEKWNNTFKAPEIKPSPVTKEFSDAKFFEAVDKMGVEWREWAKKFSDVYMTALQAADARLVTLEHKAFIATPVKPAYAKPAGDQRLWDQVKFRFSRMGFKFEVTADPVSRITTGVVVAAPTKYVNSELLASPGEGIKAITHCIPTDTFSAKHGAKIVMMKMIAQIKSLMIGKSTQRHRALRNTLKHLQVKIEL